MRLEGVRHFGRFAGVLGGCPLASIIQSDVTDDEWAFAAPYLTLMTQDAPQRDHPLRETFNGLRWMARTGAHWRLIANDLPP